MNKDDQVSCGEHGESFATFICKHLSQDPVQRWYTSPPSEDNVWPDAWCSKCHVEFLKEDEWNEKNQDGLVIKIACHKCYERAQAKSLERLDDQASREWDRIVTESVAALREKQDLLEQDFDLGNLERWDWDQDTAKLIFSHKGIAIVDCDIAFVGSISTISNTWLWSWSNFQLTEAVRNPMLKVREFGDEHDFPRLIVPKWPADEADGWEMTAVAIEVLNAQGAYRTPGETGFTYLAILKAKRVG